MSKLVRWLRDGERKINLTSVFFLFIIGVLLAVWSVIQVGEMGDPPYEENNFFEAVLLYGILFCGICIFVLRFLGMHSADFSQRRAHLSGLNRVLILFGVIGVFVWFWSDEGDPSHSNTEQDAAMKKQGRSE